LHGCFEKQEVLERASSGYGERLHHRARQGVPEVLADAFARRPKENQRDKMSDDKRDPTMLKWEPPEDSMPDAGFAWAKNVKLGGPIHGPLFEIPSTGSEIRFSAPDGKTIATIRAEGDGAAACKVILDTVALVCPIDDVRAAIHGANKALTDGDLMGFVGSSVRLMLEEKRRMKT
jgi:hypothetical protein